MLPFLFPSRMVPFLVGLDVWCLRVAVDGPPEATWAERWLQEDDDPPPCRPSPELCLIEYNDPMQLNAESEGSML